MFAVVTIGFVDAVSTVREDGGPVVARVLKLGGSAAPLSVAIATEDGTAEGVYLLGYGCMSTSQSCLPLHHPAGVLGISNQSERKVLGYLCCIYIHYVALLLHQWLK